MNIQVGLHPLCFQNEAEAPFLYDKSTGRLGAEGSPRTTAWAVQPTGTLAFEVTEELGRQCFPFRGQSVQCS